MVYVIIVYDIGIERQNEIREFLKKFLTHVQNSVFEGELPESKVFYIKKWLEQKICKERDSIIIYVLQDTSSLKYRLEIGQSEDSMFL